MSDVDEILATGRYTDRRGREWVALGNAWVLLDPWRWPNKPKRESMTAPEMSLLIRRDMHRDECGGLLNCRYHLAPGVIVQYNEDGLMYYGSTYTGRGYSTLAEAMNAAYRLAVGDV